MHIKKILIAGLVVDILSFVIALPSYKLFSWVFELEPVNIWRWTPQVPLSSFSPWWLIFIITVNTILAIYLVVLYAILYKSIPKTGVKKGIIYGLLIYPLVVLISMFSVYSFFNIAGKAVIYFILEGLLEFIIYGAVIGLIYKIDEEKEFAAT